MIELSRLRRMLVGHARQQETTTYQALAARLGLRPPRTIAQVTHALEIIMAQDAVTGEPQLAAVVVAKAGTIPRPGFFDKARSLGLYEGKTSGPHAELWHLHEREKLHDFWQTHDPKNLS